MLLFAFLVRTNIQADTSWPTQEAGWKQITALPDNLEDYYFAFVHYDQTRDLMLGFGYGTTGKQGTEYKTMIYYTCVNPAEDKSRLWTIERMTGVSGYENKWAIRNASAPELVLTGNSNACFYRTMTETTPTQYSAVNLIYDADGYWLVQNGKLEGNNYLGPWNGGEFANGMEVALNKPNDGTRAGRFKLYAILRSEYRGNEKLSISSAGYATFAPAGNVTIPSDVTAYTVTVNNGNSTITLNQIPTGSVIGAGTGVLVAGDNKDYTFNGTTSDASTLPANDLLVAEKDKVADGTQYGLAQVNGKVGFFKIKSGTTMTEGKAYLQVNGVSGAKTTFFSLDGEVTGISTVEAAEVDNGAFYTLQGVKIAKPSKGLYIQRGKKVFVK